MSSFSVWRCVQAARAPTINQINRSNGSRQIRCTPCVDRLGCLGPDSLAACRFPNVVAPRNPIPAHPTRFHQIRNRPSVDRPAQPFSTPCDHGSSMDNLHVFSIFFKGPSYRRTAENVAFERRFPSPFGQWTAGKPRRERVGQSKEVRATLRLGPEHRAKGMRFTRIERFEHRTNFIFAMPIELRRKDRAGVAIVHDSE